jgi:hypothetical protein
MDEVFDAWWDEKIEQSPLLFIFNRIQDRERAKSLARMAWEEAWQVGYSDGQVLGNCQ